MLYFIHSESQAKISKNKDARAKVLEFIDRPSYLFIKLHNVFTGRFGIRLCTYLILEKYAWKSLKHDQYYVTSRVKPALAAINGCDKIQTKWC